MQTISKITILCRNTFKIISSGKPIKLLTDPSVSGTGRNLKNLRNYIFELPNPFLEATLNDILYQISPLKRVLTLSS